MWITAGLAVAGGLLSLGIREEKRCAPKAQMTVRELVAIGKERKILTVSLIAALVQFAAFGAGTTFAPLLAEQKLGANDTQLGILAAVMAGSGIPATLLCRCQKDPAVERKGRNAGRFAGERCVLCGVPVCTVAFRALFDSIHFRVCAKFNFPNLHEYVD